MREKTKFETEVVVCFEQSSGNWWQIARLDVSPYESGIAESQVLECFNAFAEKLSHLTGKQIRVDIERKSRELRHFEAPQPSSTQEGGQP